MKMEEMNWKEIEDYLKNRDSVIVPIGSMEQHGPCLPLATDTIVASAIAQEVGKRTNTLVAPCLRPGLSLVPHMAFPGTITLDPKTFSDVIEQTIKSLYKHGFRKFLLVNAHGLNDSPIASAMQVCSRDLDELRFMVANWWEMKSVKDQIEKEFPGHIVGHAEEVEASLMLYLNEKLVKLKPIKHDNLPSFYVSLKNIRKELTDTGVISGDLSKAKKEIGKKIFDNSVNEYINILNLLEM